MPDPIPGFTYLVQELKKLQLEYLHVIAPRYDNVQLAEVDDSNRHESNDFIFDIWGKTSPIIVAGGYNPESAEHFLEENKERESEFIVAFGKHFIANPDLPFRIANALELNPYDRQTFYVPELPKGYVDYPFSDAWIEKTKTAGGKQLNRAIPISL